MENKYYRKMTVPALRSGLVIYLITLSAGFGSIYYGGGVVDWIFNKFIWASVLGVVVVPVLILISSRAYPVRVSSDGLEGINVYLWPITIAWENMVKVQPINLFGMKYLRVFPNSGKSPMWIPISLTDSEGFLESIHACGGDRDLFSPYFVQDS